MFSKDSLKLKIQTAVTVALIASGIIPAVQAEVTDESVNNPSGTDNYQWVNFVRG